MSEIHNISGVPAVPPDLRVRAPSADVTADGVSAAAEDRVEISDLAQMMEKLRSLPEIRQDVVNQIRGQIEAGTYETPERIEGTVEILLDELGY